jgi:hypothetical protein
MVMNPFLLFGLGVKPFKFQALIGFVFVVKRKPNVALAHIKTGELPTCNVSKNFEVARVARIQMHGG